MYAKDQMVLFTKFSVVLLSFSENDAWFKKKIFPN